MLAPVGRRHRRETARRLGRLQVRDECLGQGGFAVAGLAGEPVDHA